MGFVLCIPGWGRGAHSGWGLGETRQIPKSVEDIERAMAEARQDPLAEYVSQRRGF